MAALVSITDLKSFLGLTDDELWVSGLRIYSTSLTATAATVQVSDTTLTLSLTDGLILETPFLLADPLYDTLTKLAAAINVLPAWYCEVLSVGAALSVDLAGKPETNCLLEANAVTLQIVDNYRLNTLIDIVSADVETYCDLDFEETSTSEIRDGNGLQTLILYQRPVQRVTKLVISRTTAFNVTTTLSTATHASVRTSTTNMVLTIVGGAGAGTNTLTYADYSTLADLQTAINALGNGWTATVSSEYTDWAPTELIATNSAFNCLDVSVGLEIFATPESDFLLYPTRGWLQRNGGFTRGLQNILIEYVLGYAIIPDDLQGAVLDLISYKYYASRTDPTLNSERLGDYGWSRGGGGANSITTTYDDLMARKLDRFRKFIVVTA